MVDGLLILTTMYLLNKVAALKNGDEIVFSELFNEYHSKVYFYFLSKTQSKYLAEEITQITFIKLWDYRSTLDESLSLSLQIFRIAKTTCIDLFRKEAAKSKSLAIEKKKDVFSNDVTENIDSREIQRKLAYAVAKMPPVRRKVFELSRYESKSHKEISQLLSLSEKTVQNHISLAIKQLRHVFYFLLFFLSF